MSLLATLAVAVTGAVIMEAVRMPAGALVGAMVGVAVLKLTTGVAADVPPPIHFAVYVMLGWVIGQSMQREALAALGNAAFAMLGSIVALILFGVLLAVILSRLGVVDSATAFLAACPGGLSQMAALGSAVGANVPLVIGVHLVRISTVLFLAPLVVRWFR